MFCFSSRQNRYIQQLVKQVNDSNVAEALMMRTTLKDLKEHSLR